MKKRRKTEGSLVKHRQVGMPTSRGKSVAEAVLAIRVTEVTYCRWPRGFGYPKTSPSKRQNDLEAEIARPGRAVSDLTLDKRILPKAARRNF
jgi:putative transposase